MNSFAPGSINPQCFIVLNIAMPPKTIRIFNEPINYGCTRDLLRIPGVSEGEIRSSLLKGTLKFKAKAQEIIVLCSDVDLTQYNLTQKAFLQSIGIVNGLGMDGYGGGITAEQHQELRQLIHFIDNGPGIGFGTEMLRTTTPAGSPFPTNITWFNDLTGMYKIVEKIITYNTNKTVASELWNMYDSTGTNIVQTVVDTFFYTNNVFESSRVRTVLLGS